MDALLQPSPTAHVTDQRSCCTSFLPTPDLCIALNNSRALAVRCLRRGIGRFLFFITGQNRILGGTQDTLQVLTETGEADFGDQIKVVSDIVDEASMSTLLTGAEAAFNKNHGQLMKFVEVRRKQAVARCLFPSSCASALSLLPADRPFCHDLAAFETHSSRAWRVPRGSPRSPSTT